MRFFTVAALAAALAAPFVAACPEGMAAVIDYVTSTTTVTKCVPATTGGVYTPVTSSTPIVVVPVTSTVVVSSGTALPGSNSTIITSVSTGSPTASPTPATTASGMAGSVQANMGFAAGLMGAVVLAL